MESVKQEDIIPPEHRGRMSTAVQSVPSLHAEDYEDEGRILEQANAGFWPALGYWTSPPWPEEKQRVQEMYWSSRFDMVKDSVYGTRDKTTLVL